MQLLAYEEQGIPAVWYDSGSTSTYGGACARRKMLDPSFGVPLVSPMNGEEYPRVEPLIETLKKHPNFFCHGCNREHYQFETHLHYLRAHLEHYEIAIPNDQIPAGTSGPESQPLEPETEL
jgi:hypothetical protein